MGLKSKAFDLNRLLGWRVGWRLTCVNCKQEFTDENVKSAEGWQETQISGFCETCFDGLFDEHGDMKGA